MRISLFIESPLQRLRFVKVLIGLVPIFILLWILNQNIAFTGTHRVSISSFLNLPRSVVYTGGAEVGLVSTPDGMRTRPYKDQTQFAVTLPRGFDTMTMRAELAADPDATITMGAKVPATAPSQSADFRLPSAYGAEWRGLSLGTGTLYVKNNPEIKTADAFWNTFTKLKKIYSIGDGLTGFIPPTLYAGSANVTLVQLPGGYRGSFFASGYFDGKPQQVTFDTKAAYGVSKSNVLRFTIEKQGEIVVLKNIALAGQTSQRIVVDVPAGDPGFYTLRFAPDSEAIVVSNVQFQGDAVELSNNLFLDQSSSPVTLYTKCADMSVTAVHQLGTQNPISANGKKIQLKSVKQAQKIHVGSGVNTVVFPRADVGLTNSCGFMLQPDHSLRTSLEKLAGRIIVAPQLTAATVAAAEFIYDPNPMAAVMNVKQGTVVVEKIFNLHSLSAKGKTFIFSLESPGLTTRPGAYLHIKKITFTAKRPTFSFKDIGRAFRALSKR